MEYKQCTTCAETKPTKEFYKRSKSRDGLQRSCKKCCNRASTASRKKLYKRNQVARDYARARNHARKYGITLDEYYTLKEVCQGKCEICREELPLMVDHDHDSGKVRGMLCGRHNVGLGFFDDSPELLEAAALYLRSKR